MDAEGIRTYEDFVAEYGKRPPDIVFKLAYKAGYQQCKKESDEALIILEKEIKERLDEERKAGLEQGREEAVELIKRYFDILPLASKRRIQAQLKEWGI